MSRIDEMLAPSKLDEALLDPGDAREYGIVESMYQSPGEGVVGCQDPRVELPIEVAVETAAQQAEEKLVGVVPMRRRQPQRLRHKG